MPIADRFQLVWTPFLRREKGRFLQPVGLICPTVLGSGGEFTLRIGSRQHAARSLDLIRYPHETRDQNLPIRYLWLIPRPDRPVQIHAEWKTPLGPVYRDRLVLRPAVATTVHVIFKTHFDLGYTHRLGDVIRLYQTRFMERLLDNLDKTADRPPHRRFVWTLSTWLLEQCLDRKGVKPEHRRRLEKHIRDGSVVWGLTPFTTHSEFFGLEEMCRSLYAARRLAERFNRPVPRAAKMTDVPAHTASLAMALAAAGGTFFHIGTNPESLPPAVPPLFWWKLPDGRQLLTHYRGTYGSPLLPPEDWPWSEWLSVQITSDNVGPQNLDAIHSMDWIERHFDFPVCRTGRLEDFADAIIRQHGKDLPVVDKEFTDWWIHGIASDARHTALARQAKERLPSAETIAALTSWASGRPVGNLHVDARKAYEQLSLYTEHTWGDHATDASTLVPEGSLYTSAELAAEKTAPPLDRWTASWDDKAGFARRAYAAAEQVQERATLAFARHLRGSGNGLGIALFNSLGWARGGPVRVSNRGLPKGEFELVDPTTGDTVIYERDARGWLDFVAPPVPACGYLVLQVRSVIRRGLPGLPADWEERNLSLHTNDTTLQFHTNGGLSRWHDRARSTQWCSCETEFPLGTYLYEMPGGEKLREFARHVHSNSYAETCGYFHRPDYDRMSQFGPVGGGRAVVRPQITPLCMTVAVEADCPVRKVPGRRSGDAHRYRSTFTMYRGLRDLHVSLELIDKRATYAAEAGYGFFPLAGEQWMLVDRVAHQLQPHHDLGRGVNAAHMAVSRGLRIEGKHAGMNFYPLHTPLVGFGRPGAYAFDENGDYENAILYATLFNNCWGTNFRQWQSGDFRFDFVLRPSGNDAWDGGLARGGAEVFRPLVAMVVKAPRGEAARSLLEIRPACVQLVTLKPAEFDAGTILRLWNAGADPAVATLLIPGSRRGSTLVACDLLEHPTQTRFDVSPSGRATIALRPFQIATLLLKRGD